MTIKNITIVMSLILVTLIDGLCAIEFIGSDTTAQVATSAGTSRQSGISETLSTGIVNNDAFAVVSQDAQGNGSGSATATIQVDPLGQPKEMFAFMQVAASALPEFDSGTFAEAKVTYFFSNPIEIEVERGIDQGDTRFFIDNVRQPLLGSVARFSLPQGLHSFEIEVVPGTTVVNPNISVRIFALDNSDDDSGPTTSPTLNDRLDEAVSIARSIKSKLTNQNRNAQRKKLSLLKRKINKIDNLVRSRALELPKKPRSRMISAVRDVTRDLVALEEATKAGRSSAKASLLKSMQNLQNLVENNLN